MMNPQHGYDHWGRLSEGRRPVCKGDDWFYVDEAGDRLSNSQTWQSASWFYNGFAVVEDERGWYHVDHLFQPLYDQRWAFAGSFSGDPLKAVVRDAKTGEEFHIFPDGSRVPAEPKAPVSSTPGHSVTRSNFSMPQPRL